MNHIKRQLIVLIATSLLPFTIVAQNIEDIISTIEIDTLLNNGPKDNRINYAFGNIRPKENENPYPSQDDLVKVVGDLLPYFNPDLEQGKLGFAQYSNFFNLYSLWFPDPIVYESVPEYFQLTQSIRDQIFLPWANDQRGWITMIYTGGGGNGVGLNREQRVADGTTSMDWETVLHEFNHTMPGVYDEYTASGEWSNYQCLEGPNVTCATELDDIPWRKWINPSSPRPTPYSEAYFDEIGLFEGNIGGYFGRYRPTAKSCFMGAGGFGERFGQEMCSVCLQRFIAMIYQYVNVIENPTPANSQIEINGATQLTFSANILKPQPNTQKYEWFLNGQLIASQIESVEVSFDACDSYNLTLVVTDTTGFFRYDEKFKDIYPEPKQTYSWTIDQSSVSEYNLTSVVTTTTADCQSINNGQIVLEATGGLPPYNYFLNGQIGNGVFDNLKPGQYQAVSADANGCSVSETVELVQEDILTFDLCASYTDELWEISAMITSGNTDPMTYSWSTGANTPSIAVSEIGSYTVDITTSNGCTISKEIEISEISEPLTIENIHTNTVVGKDNGSANLTIVGGSEPYHITWYSQEVKDQTVYDASKVISSGNGEIGIHLPEFVFDDDLSFGYDFWAENFTGNNYIGYNFGTLTRIDAYSITSNVDVKERDAKGWKLQGSNDGTVWIDIQTIQDFNFPNRLETFQFELDEPAEHQFFRLQITENWGGGFDGWVAIQQVEFGAFENMEMRSLNDLMNIHHLSAGRYSYKVSDRNKYCQEGNFEVESSIDTSVQSITVRQEGDFTIIIDNPNNEFEYHWSKQNDGSETIHIGTDYQPISPGQYFIRALNKSTNAFNDPIKGISVKMDSPPDIGANSLGMYVIDPQPSYEYRWYVSEQGGTPAHVGLEYSPPVSVGSYYVTAKKVRLDITPVDPATIDGITLWMDASDLNGDGVTNDLPNSSAYDWQFIVGGNWREDGWFPYRANYQNGLGVVDFATMWFQYIDTEPSEMRTIVLAYEESGFSFYKTAPTQGLKNYIPRHEDSTQLFSNDAPPVTLNGQTYLNGELVDPLQTGNPMEFMILSVLLAETVNNDHWASDEFWEGKLGELITWDVALSEEQIKGVNEHLKRKWLVTAELESPRTTVTWGADILLDIDNDGFKEDVDCDDSNPSIYPGAPETCDGLDNNCDGTADENLLITFYADADGDGFGNTEESIIACVQPSGFVIDSSDCDDNMSDINPSAIEIPYNQIDDDCNPATADTIDLDGDGFNSNVDCDDNNSDIHPGAEDIPGNGIDEDCDGEDLVTALQNIDESISIYPNPVIGSLTISSSRLIQKIELLTLVGVKIKTITGESDQDLFIDFTSLAQGMYLLKIYGVDDQLYSYKVFK